MNFSLLRIPAYWLKYYMGWPDNGPLNLTVSVTFMCNSRCLTCNIWRKKPQNELTLEEFDKTFASMDNIYWLTLSGGEPMLRNDLPDIALSAYKRIHPKIINIPTNALVKDTTKKVDEIASRCHCSKIIVNVSIDGTWEEDEMIRGVSGAYDTAIKTIKDLREIKRKNLVIGVHTVVSKYNIEHLPQIFEAVRDVAPDSYVTEIAEERVELGNLGSNITPGPDAYATVVKHLMHNISSHKYSGLPKITQAFRQEYYRIAEQTLRKRLQIIPCYAGIASAHISPYGDVWACCVQAQTLGNLRESGYDFKRIWRSVQAREIRRSVKNNVCFCPLANAHYTNMLLHLPTLVKVIWHILI